MKAVKAYSHVDWFENEKGGDMDLGITFTNQPSRAPQRNPVRRKPFGAKFSDRGLSETPLRRLGENIEAVSPLSKADNGGSIQNLPESSTPQQPLSVQLPPPPKDIGEYQKFGDQGTLIKEKEDVVQFDPSKHPAPPQVAGNKRLRGDGDDNSEEHEAKHYKALIAQTFHLDPTMS
uniref:Uncharacterized protein n=1 Tax=Passalora fulva TaxID=5499 RepID=A0A9Q8LC82_PASFU